MKQITLLILILFSTQIIAVDLVREKTLLTVSVKELKEIKQLLGTALKSSDRNSKYRLKYSKLMLDIDLWITEIERYKKAPNRSPDIAFQSTKENHTERNK